MLNMHQITHKEKKHFVEINPKKLVCPIRSLKCSCNKAQNQVKSSLKSPKWVFPIISNFTCIWKKRVRVIFNPTQATPQGYVVNFSNASKQHFYVGRARPFIVRWLWWCSSGATPRFDYFSQHMLHITQVKTKILLFFTDLWNKVRLYLLFFKMKIASKYQVSTEGFWICTIESVRLWSYFFGGSLFKMMKNLRLSENSFHWKISVYENLLTIQIKSFSRSVWKPQNLSTFII